MMMNSTIVNKYMLDKIRDTKDELLTSFQQSELSDIPWMDMSKADNKLNIVLIRATVQNFWQQKRYTKTFL